ncbi:MAG: hypothetical protein KJ963_06085 [Bacteroidetes bacterium]|nr:hypothetical protein [Bacteroidota bacterium]
MARYNIHKTLIIGFTALFVVFNVGLPVIIHTCEMMKTASISTCDMCHMESQQDNQARFNPLTSSCCKKVIVAEPNKIEFLQTQKNDLFSSIQHSITPTIHSFALDEPTSIAQLHNFNPHSPTIYQDIPILNSSLLI